MFWNRFSLLCDNHGVKPNPCAKKLGISSGTVTLWKSGGLPNGENLIKIAEYLDCSVDYLLGRTDNPKAHKSSMSEIQIEEPNKRISSLNLSENEFASIKRYSALDSHGKSLVDTIIDKEYNRCTKSKTPEVSQLSNDDIIETSKGKYKVARTAAFGGGTMDILIPADVSPDEINRMIDEKADFELRKENEKIGDEIIEKAKKSK